MRKQLQYTISIIMEDDWTESRSMGEGRRQVAEQAVHRAISKHIMDPVVNNGFVFSRVSISPPSWFDCSLEVDENE
jgi:hypothetical protein